MPQAHQAPGALHAGDGACSSAAGHLHAVDQHRTDGLGAIGVGIGPDGLDALEHVLEVAGDGDLMHREGDAAVLDPEAAGAARVVTRHVVHALAHQLGHEQTGAQVFQHIDVLGEHLLAQRVEQKGAFAVQRAAAHGLRKAAQQAGGQGRLEQHRALGGGDLAGLEAAQCTLGCITPHRLGAGQLVGAALRAVPGVALHVGVLAGQRRDGRHRQAVARTGIATAKTVGVGTEKMRLLGRHASPLAVGDAPAGGQGGGLAGLGQADGLLGIQRPGVEQVQVGLGGGNVGLIRQAGTRVFGGEAGNVVGGLHGLQNGTFREIGGAGIAPAVPQVHGHPQRLVAVAFDVFKLALAHTHTEPAALGGLRASVGGTQLERMRQGGVHQVFKGFSGVAEAAGGRCLGFLHSGGYDTCRSGSPVALTPDTPNMSRKPKKGYYVRGQFVAEGSELDLQLKAELKGTDEASKTELKRESTALQKLGEDLLTLRADLMEKLPLSDKLVDALAEAKRITNFEGKRRQMQFVGKLMRLLDAGAVEAVKTALEVQRKGSAADTAALHLAEQWRDRLIGTEEALGVWMDQHPDTDTQQLRALIRQARKDAPPADKAAVSQGLAPRQSRAYRELFRLVRRHLNFEAEDTDHADDHDD